MSIIETYNNICRYDISQPIQKLDIDCDVNAIKQEATQIINDGKYGFKPLILTLPPGNTEWDAEYEDLQYAGVNACGEDYSKIKWVDQSQPIFSDGTDYTEWHPQCKHIQDFKYQLEDYSGLTITKVRLMWMMPDYTYPFHADFEPMRFHVPIFTNTYCHFIHDEKIYNMPYGSAYHLIANDIHSALNFGLYPRLHLVYCTLDDKNIVQNLAQQVHDKIKKLNVRYTDQQDLDNIIQMCMDEGREDLVEIYRRHKMINTVNERDQRLEEIRLNGKNAN